MIKHRPPGERVFAGGYRPWVVVLLVGATSFATGCSGEPDSVPVPVRRLVHEIERRADVKRIGPCQAGGEVRPALGCDRWRRIKSRIVESSVEGTARVELTDLGSRPLVIEARVEGKMRGSWSEPMTRFLSSPSGVEWLEVELPEQPDGKEPRVAVRGRPLPPGVQQFSTREIEVGEGAELRVGIAMDRLASLLGASSVEFVLSSRAGSTKRDLLRRVLGPEHAGDGWVDQRIDLSELSGKKVQFFFSTTMVADAPASGARLALPLWGSPEILEPRARGSRRSIILVSLDTLRGDHVGASLFGQALTPELDRIARQGTRFEQAVSTYSSTTAAHMSLLTGLYPGAHGVFSPGRFLCTDVPTLAERLAAHGYQTSAVTENGMISAMEGFARGFDFYREVGGNDMWDALGNIETTFEHGIQWIRAHRREPFFLFLHTYQVHAPYDPPKAFEVMEEARQSGESSSAPVSQAEHRGYAGEVRYVDRVMRRLLDEVLALVDPSSLILVVTSDHGEEFAEHGGRGHARTLYDEVLRVPLIVWAPGLVPAGGRVAAATSLVDVVPTLLELVQVPPVSGVNGQSLVPWMTVEPTADRVVFAEQRQNLDPRFKNRNLLVARSTTYKWIADYGGRVPEEIYNLRADPAERHSLASESLAQTGAEHIRAYRELLDRGLRCTAVASRPALLGAERAKKLKALGYLQ